MYASGDRSHRCRNTINEGDLTNFSAAGQSHPPPPPPPPTAQEPVPQQRGPAWDDEELVRVKRMSRLEESRREPVQTNHSHTADRGQSVTAKWSLIPIHERLINHIRDRSQPPRVPQPGICLRPLTSCSCDSTLGEGRINVCDAGPAPD